MKVTDFFIIIRHQFLVRLQNQLCSNFNFKKPSLIQNHQVKTQIMSLPRQTNINKQFQYQMYRRPQSAKPQIQFRTPTQERFSIRKKLEREIVASNMLKNKRSLLASNFMNRHSQISRIVPQYVSSSPERLFEQNLILKREINDLQEDMRLLKAKLEAEKRNNTKYVNQLDAEFGKEMFWSTLGSGNHVVMGVKRQYEKLKQKMEQTEQQLVDIKRTVQFTQIQQITIQRDQYKASYERLAQQLSELPEYGQINSSEQDQNEEDYIAPKKRSSTMQHSATSQDYEFEIDRLIGEVEQQKKKIDFLENRLVEKENTEFSLNAANRKLSQQAERLKQKNREMTRTFELERENLKTKLQDARESQRKRYEKELVMFNAQMDTKNALISKLQKEIGYLSTLLSYWKPLQDPSSEDFPKRDVQREAPVLKQSALSFRKDLELPGSGMSQSSDKANSMEKSIKMSKADSIRADQTAEIKTPSRVVNNTLESDNRKTIQNYALKRYKVKKEQVALIGEEIRYKLLNAKIQMKEAVKYFDTQEQFISIEQIKEILQAQPFNIGVEDNAILLARYLVEDQNDQIVYYDPKLTNECTMAKAIFQQVVPKYLIHSQQQKKRISEGVITMLKQYNNLLTQTIGTQCGAKCILSKQKFVDILNQQELNHGQEAIDFMVSTMLKHSRDLSTLEFKKLAEYLPITNPVD